MRSLSLPFRAQLSLGATLLVVVTVSAMLVPVYLSARRAMLHATREEITSRARALSRAAEDVTLDSAYADTTRITVASASLRRVLLINEPHGGRGDVAEYVLITRQGLVRVASSVDTTWRSTRLPWAAPRGLLDSLHRLVATDSTLFVFRENGALFAVAPVYRHVSVPAGLAVVRADIGSRTNLLLTDLARFWWLPALIVLAAVGIALSAASRLGRRLSRLADRARLAADGNLDAFVAGRAGAAHDELDVLHDALARMSEGLRVQLERADRQARMEAVGRLAASVAHDFNNVLAIIRASADLGVVEAKEGGDPVGDLEEIRRATLRGAALTRQLLLFSGQRKAEHRYVSIDHLLHAVEPMLRRLFTPSLEIGVIGASGAVVTADPVQLEQALVNLAINARDAMPNGGTLVLSTRRSTAEEVEGLMPSRHGYVSLDVTDSGHGIDPSLQARIFEPFFTTKEAGKGTGLGLASAAKLLQDLGGTIRVKSVLGQGATFTLVMPVAPVPESVDTRMMITGESPAPAGAEGHDAGSSARILVVEDETAVREMVARVLRAAGHDVLQARHGVDALTILERSAAEVHLVISDVLMPAMNGDELARRLAVMRPSLPVLLMSGYPGQNAVGEVLLKPFSSEELLQRVRALIDMPVPQSTC